MIINLATPIGHEKVRTGFQPHWRTVFIYKCAHGHTIRVYANAFSGKNPVPGIGSIVCSQCEFKEKHTS